jgi:HPt (histidine-containing phosphotransfer) domain-containing protein
MDLKELAERIGLEETEYRDMLDLFIESAGADLNKLEAALAAGDAAKAHEASHSFKGSSGSLCLDSLFELAKAIDDQDRQGLLAGLDKKVRQLRTEYEKLASMLAHRRSG